jgi:hypothetical protein
VVDLVDGERVTVKEELHGPMYNMAAFFSRRKKDEELGFPGARRRLCNT